MPSKADGVISILDSPSSSPGLPIKCPQGKLYGIVCGKKAWLGVTKTVIKLRMHDKGFWVINGEKATEVTSRCTVVIVNGPKGGRVPAAAVRAKEFRPPIPVVYTDPSFFDEIGVEYDALPPSPPPPPGPRTAPPTTRHPRTAPDHGAEQNFGTAGLANGTLYSEKGTQMLEKASKIAADIVSPRGAVVPVVFLKAMIMRPHCAACGDLKISVVPILRRKPGFLGCTNYPTCKRMMFVGEMKAHAAAWDSDNVVY